MVKGCPGIDMKAFTDLSYGRGITSFFDKGPDEIKDFFLPGRQFHDYLLKLKILYICLVVKPNFPP
jgi:hypothetical protein